MWIDILLVLFVAFIIIGCKYTLPSKQFNDYLDIEPTKALRGILAIEIVFYHMAENGVDGRIFSHLGHIGYLPVCVFFFLSGFGLISQYNKKGNNYLNGFWKSRITYLLIVYILVSILYALFRIFVSKSITIKQAISAFIHLTPLSTGLWYVIVLLILYIFFWIAFKINIGNSKRILIITLLTVLLSVLFYFTKDEINWYQSNLAFVLGLFWGQYKDKIDSFMANKKKYIFSFLAFALLTALFFALTNYCKQNKPIYIISRNLFNIGATSIIILIMKIVKPTAKYWKWLGGISLEIYLLQQLVWRTLRSKIINIDNDFLWTLLTLIITIIVALLTSVLNKKLYSVLKSTTKKEREEKIE